MAPAIEGGAIKGAAVREFIRWYAGREGPSRLRTIVDRMPEVHRKRLDPDSPALGLLANTWYEADLVHALLDAMAQDMDARQRDELARGGAEAVMAATLKGLYKVLFSWMASPARYARFSPKLWASYYDCGEFEVQSEPGRAVCTIRNWSTHHAVICDLNREAARQIYLAMGCKGVNTERTRCVAEGHDHCCFVTTWDE